MGILKPTRLYKDIDLSFSQNPNTKDVNKKIDVQAVKQHKDISKHSVLRETIQPKVWFSSKRFVV